MKKKTMSLALMLLMFFVLAPAAFADEFCTIGSVIAGSDINVPISTVSDTAGIIEADLPEGCVYTEEPIEDGGRRIYLRGCPLLAGEQSFSLTVSDEQEYKIMGTMSVQPDVPLVTSPGSVSCAPGAVAVLEVQAEIFDAGMLSYQWFRDADIFPQEIDGAQAPSYEPDTREVGSRSYFCRVTNTNNGFISFADSEIVSVLVHEPQVAAIQIETAPAVMKYTVGDEPDVTGLSLRVTYDDGSCEFVSSGFSYYPSVFSDAGTQYLHFGYKGGECVLTVAVENAEEEIAGIGVLTLPYKTEYTVNDLLETAGLSIRVYTNYGQYDVSSGLDCSPTEMWSEGRQTVTVSYGGRECTFIVNVKPQAPEPTPGPVPTAAAETAEPEIVEETETPRVALPSGEKGAKILVRIIFVASAAALAGLCAYIVYMNKHGIK